MTCDRLNVGIGYSDYGIQHSFSLCLFKDLRARPTHLSIHPGPLERLCFTAERLLIQCVALCPIAGQPAIEDGYFSMVHGLRDAAPPGGKGKSTSLDGREPRKDDAYRKRERTPRRGKDPEGIVHDDMIRRLDPEFCWKRRGAGGGGTGHQR